MPMRTSAAHTVVMAVVAVALVAPLRATAQTRAPRTSVSRAADAPPGLGAIREADLRRDMEALAGDAMRGREAGTLDELRASAWLAERARAAGLEPAGEDGTYFQFWPMRRAVTSPASRATYDGTSLDLTTEAVVSPPVDATIDAPILALAPGMTVDQVERKLIELTLAHTRDNKTRAAEILGVTVKTLHNKLKRFRREEQEKP